MLNRERVCVLATAHSFISAILFRVRNSFRFAAVLSAGSVFVLAATPHPAGRKLQAALQAPSQQEQQPGIAPQQSVPPQGTTPQIAPQPPAHVGPVIVIDPGHGGTDTGARGASGVIEKDMVLLFARTSRYALEREGFRVVMTRNDDSNPSYDDRAAIANSYRDVIFVSFHISSTGTLHTARAYSYVFSETEPNTSVVSANANSLPITPVKTTNLLPWAEAQRPFVNASKHLADLLQADLTLHFAGSPAASSAVAVRGLRSVAAPAVAIEVSNVGVSDPNELVAMAAPVATAMVHSIVASRPSVTPTAIPGTR
jgi:N-acetylmuramoyl-L-alanine amidase